MRGVWLLVVVAGCGRLGFDPAGTVDAPTGAITASSLAVEWATPNVTMWRWEWAGDPALLDHFELVTGASSDDVRLRTLGASIVGPTVRPELGYPTLPHSNGFDRVDHTPVAVTPGATVFAALVAFDRDGRESWTDIVEHHAPPLPLRSILLYGDAIPNGAYTIPAELAQATDMPAQGGVGFRYDSTCPAGDCFENLRLHDVNVPINDIAMQGAFDAAYLEMFVSTTIEPSYWTQIRLCMTDCSLAQAFGYAWITIASDADYQRVEVPLASLRNDVRALAPADLTELVNEWCVGGRWAAGSTTRVDEVRIRY